jgi:hypothetical protein
MTSSSNSESDPINAGILIVLIIGLFYFFFGFLPERNVSEPTKNNKCKYVTKEVQTIKKIDGNVDSVETEMVHGCEYPDGSFLSEPDYEK